MSKRTASKDLDYNLKAIAEHAHAILEQRRPHKYPGGHVPQDAEDIEAESWMTFKAVCMVQKHRDAGRLDRAASAAIEVGWHLARMQKMLGYSRGGLRKSLRRAAQSPMQAEQIRKLFAQRRLEHPTEKMGVSCTAVGAQAKPSCKGRHVQKIINGK